MHANYLIGAGLRDVNGGERDAEGAGGDLRHFGVQALTHLGAAVRHQHRPVVVHVNERARLRGVGMSGAVACVKSVALCCALRCMLCVLYLSAVW